MSTTHTAYSAPRTSSPSSKGLKVAGIVVLVLLTIIGILWAMVWSAVGGIAYEPQDRTVRSARTAADRTARADLEAVLTAISPGLGAPTLRAFVDSCTSNEWFNNRLTCVRTYYVYYALGDAVPQAATLAGPIPTTTWQSDDCHASRGTTEACRHRDGAYGTRLNILVVSSEAARYDRGPFVVAAYDRADESGIEELTKAVAAGNYALVEYGTRYFSD